MNEELKNIKKLYGEEMAHLCRELFPTILEKEGLLLNLLTTHFNPSRFLYEDIVKESKAEDFKNCIYKSIDIKKKEIITEKTPTELLSEVGYDLYECTTEEEIQSFKKYYAEDEELCTFRGGRLDFCRVFFAVKKDVNNIKREDFLNPERQDLYGTSVISIQFSKGNKNNLSIKNRYNHTVSNPDATFGNNLENIIPGLTSSFNNHYGLNKENDDFEFELEGYVKLNGKYYKYNYEHYNVYYCPDNIIIDNYEVKKYDPSRYLLIDNFILDLKEKTIDVYSKRIIDGFVDSLEDMNKISITNTEYGKEIRITFKNNTKKAVIIKIDKTNSIIGLSNSNLEEAKGRFLVYNIKLSELSLPNLKIARNNFLCSNNVIAELYFPLLETIGDNFLYSNDIITELYFPLLKTIENNFLSFNQSLKKLTIPNLKTLKNGFLCRNKELTELNLPYVTVIGNDFLFGNKVLKKLDLPSVTEIGNWFLCYNEALKELYTPQINYNIGHSSLANNQNCVWIKVPQDNSRMI